jgi:hypothetical protein
MSKRSTTVVINWKCGCGTHITALVESMRKGTTSQFPCPTCHDKETIYAGKVVSHVAWQTNCSRSYELDLVASRFRILRDFAVDSV